MRCGPDLLILDTVVWTYGPAVPVRGVSVKLRALQLVLIVLRSIANPPGVLATGKVSTTVRNS